jgi:hypothetical protein
MNWREADATIVYVPFFVMLFAEMELRWGVFCTKKGNGDYRHKQEVIDSAACRSSSCDHVLVLTGNSQQEGLSNSSSDFIEIKQCNFNN